MSSNGKIKKKSGAYYRKRQKYVQMYNNFDLKQGLKQCAEIPKAVFRCNASLGKLNGYTSQYVSLHS